MKQTKQDFYSIKIENVFKVYNKIVAVNNVSFNARPGEIIALLGPNGAGKSTLMNMIAGYLSLSKGTILINNNNATTHDLLTKKDIGFLPEGSPLYADMTVQLFLEYFVELKLNLVESEKLSKKQIKEAYQKELLRVMSTANIISVANQKIETLSKGYTRRVGFACSLIGNPPILLLDEPTDGLDPNQKKYMRTLIKEMSKDKTILISTHLLDEVEAIANRIILISKGKIVVDGCVDDILQKAKKKTLEEAFFALTNEEK